MKRKIMVGLAGLVAVLALSGCAGEEKINVFQVSINGKTVDCVEWTWVEANNEIAEVALACDFAGATQLGKTS